MKKNKKGLFTQFILGLLGIVEIVRENGMNSWNRFAGAYSKAWTENMKRRIQSRNSR